MVANQYSVRHPAMLLARAVGCGQGWVSPRDLGSQVNLCLRLSWSSELWNRRYIEISFLTGVAWTTFTLHPLSGHCNSIELQIRYTYVKPAGTGSSLEVPCLDWSSGYLFTRPNDTHHIFIWGAVSWLTGWIPVLSSQWYSTQLHLMCCVLTDRVDTCSLVPMILPTSSFEVPCRDWLDGYLFSRPDDIQRIFIWCAVTWQTGWIPV